MWSQSELFQILQILIFSMNNVETNITISGGMSEYPTHTKEMKELIEYADQAMYKTKQNGGNDITIHNQI